MKANSSRITVSILLALLLCVGLTPFASGQRRSGSGSSPAAQPLDEAYTAKIREYTTEPYFLTELVDHLPASPTVPTPEKVLGYVIGTPNKLTYTKDLYRYYRALAQASPRVKVWTVGKSEEGRDFLLVAVTDEANMAKLDRYKEITAKLADPRKLTDADAEKLVAEGKPFYWLSGSIHSPETGSPEMLMELAYRMAVSDSPVIQNIRRNLILLITPVLEVDGRDRRVDTYNYSKANPGKPAPGLIYWGKYVAHDNNRDAIGMALQLSKVQMHNFLEWHPQVLHDLHESVPFLYTSTGTGPYNAWLDPIVVSEWQKLAYYEIEEMTKRGVPGVWTHGFYDGWAPNYMFYVANGHNSIGRFYETYGGTGADTRMRRVGENQTSRTWFRPNPPLPRVKWSIRNNINMQQSGVLLAMTYTADHGAEFLRNFYLKGKRSVAKATTEGPAAWIIRNDKRPQLAAQLAHLMQMQGAEVHRLDAEFELKPERSETPERAAGEGPGGGRPAARAGASGEGEGTQEGRPRGRRQAPQPVKVPKGSYVLRMDQPYSRMVDMLLDTQYYSTSDPRPYDDTGWTLGPLRNVETHRVTDAAILKTSMTLMTSEARASGSITGVSATKFYVVNATAEPAPATLRFRMKDVKFLAAEEAFEADGKKFNAGSFLIPVEGNPSDLRARLTAATAQLGVDAHATDADITVKQHEMKLPRIALMHTWINTQNEGWFRLALDETGVPYDYISSLDVRSTPNLRSKYDVIVFPPVTSSISRLINGVSKRLLDDGSDFGGPIPWKNSELTPNLAGTDEADDIRGGLGFEGLIHLKEFIEAGGVFIPITASASLPVELGITDGVSITDTRQLAARGSVVNTTVEDKASPIAYGYDDKLAVYFSQAPVFRVSIGGGGGFGGGGGRGGGGGGRTSGRGSATDPDIPQARPWDPPEREPRRSRAEQETYIDPDTREFLSGTLMPQRMWPRVVLRFARANELWVSGMLEGGNELAESPAVIDVPVGRGHVVLFANNPMWRHETHGSFMLLLNAAMHFDHLQAGRVEKPDADEGESSGETGNPLLDGHGPW